MADDAPAQRFVPGAPPPPPLSKSQRKKRKSAIKPKAADIPFVVDSVSVTPDSKSAALIEKVPEATDNEKDLVTEPPVLAPESTQEITQEKAKKGSAVVELLNKRIKVQNKKLSRLAVYSSKPASELNEDQQRSIASLPSIQGAVRELEETRKAIEALESEEEKERERQRAEEEKATSERITNALADARDSQHQQMSHILTLLRLSSLLSTSDPTTFILNINEKERHSLFVTAEALLGSESPQKEVALDGLFLGEGDIDGTTYTRLLEIVDAFRNPPVERDPSPSPEEAVSDKDQIATVEQGTENVVAIEPLPVTADGVATTSGSFHFMQESELEGGSFEHGAEWVEKPQVAPDRVANESGDEASQALTAIDTTVSHDVNGVSKHIEEPPLSAVSATLDWAADDGDGLPSINSLHAKFGTSGAATPEGSFQDAVPVTEANKASAQSESEWDNTQKITDITPTVNGNVKDATDSWASSNAQEDEDGFVKAKSSRGKQFDNRPEFQRGRGRSGFRGDRGGEYRGGYRGRGSGGDSFGSGWRGADGEFRGRGGYRGDRGRGGDFRGGEFRGRGGRGGEFRGRGRGDRGNRGGRGGFEGNGDGERIPQS